MKHKWNYKLLANSIVQHHLLEIILWPNDDGTFTKIINSAQRLKELGIYDDKKMTIAITNSEHISLHNYNRSEETIKKLSEALKRYKVKDSTKEKLSKAFSGNKNPMYKKDAWKIACSRKTPEQIEATRKSKSEKMKIYWLKKRQQKEVCHDANHI